MIPAAAYIRVSSGMQVETGASLPSQLAEIRAYCRKNDLELLEEHIYCDAGESARTDDRPAFQAMIAAARQKTPPFETIVCWENSRFARSREDAITYKALLKRNGIDLRFVKQDFEDTPMGTFMEGIVELVDEWYSKNLAVETRRGLMENARQGYSGGGTPPYGMRRVTVTNEYGKEKATREPDPATAPIIREIYEMRGEKKMGYRAIAYALNARGIRSPKGGDWSGNTVYYMLTKNQPAYLGHLIFNRAEYTIPGQKEKPKDEWVIVENAWPAILTEEQVDAVNELAKTRNRGTTPGTTKKEHFQPFVLSGKIYCGLCGRAVNGVTSGRKGAWRYYRCNKSRDAGPDSCALPQIAQRRVENAVMEVFREKIMTDGLLEEMIEVAREGRGARGAEEKKRSAGLEKTIVDLERRKRNLLLAVEEGAMSMGDVRTRLEELNKQITEIRKDLQKIHDILRPIPPVGEWNLGEFRNELLSFMELERASALKKIVDGFVSRITLFPDYINVALMLVCDQAQQTPKSKKASIVPITPDNSKAAQSLAPSCLKGCKSEYGAEDET